MTCKYHAPQNSPPPRQTQSWSTPAKNAHLRKCQVQRVFCVVLSTSISLGRLRRDFSALIVICRIALSLWLAFAETRTMDIVDLLSLIQQTTREINRAIDSMGGESRVRATIAISDELIPRPGQRLCPKRYSLPRALVVGTVTAAHR